MQQHVGCRTRRQMHGKWCRSSPGEGVLLPSIAASAWALAEAETVSSLVHFPKSSPAPYRSSLECFHLSTPICSTVSTLSTLPWHFSPHLTSIQVAVGGQDSWFRATCSFSRSWEPLSFILRCTAFSWDLVILRDLTISGSRSAGAVSNILCTNWKMSFTTELKEACVFELAVLLSCWTSDFGTSDSGLLVLALIDAGGSSSFFLSSLPKKCTAAIMCLHSLMQGKLRHVHV